jgi:hypothetical protein
MIVAQLKHPEFDMLLSNWREWREALETAEQLADWLDDIYQRTDGDGVPCYLPEDAQRWLEAEDAARNVQGAR